jgi:hypothetical protein
MAALKYIGPKLANACPHEFRCPTIVKPLPSQEPKFIGKQNGQVNKRGPPPFHRNLDAICSFQFVDEIDEPEKVEV